MQRENKGKCAILLTLILWLHPAWSVEPMQDRLNIVYATVNGRALALDLHLPSGVAHPQLVVYAHGGAWRAGSKSEYPEFLVERGYAVASVEFRASTDARFPANVHDIKAAIRFLRAHAQDYGYEAGRIAMAGASSGGHLAALVGTTNGLAELEGSVGDFPRESSAVQAIVSWYGASNLMTILSQSTAYGLSVREPALKLLLGDLPDRVPALARLASPVTHLDATDPPAILLHGEEDPQMPIQQMRELEAAYRKAGLAVEAIPVAGARHGGEVFYAGEPAERVIAFLRRTIGP